MLLIRTLLTSIIHSVLIINFVERDERYDP